jgi:hypothetical protein
LPRRHTISAAGALALLLAVHGPAGAQTALDQSARDGTDGRQGSTSPRAQAADGAAQDQAAASGDSTEGWGTTVVPESLGGLGDEAESQPTGAPLGGLGDQPDSAALQPEETGAPVEDLARSLGLAPPSTGYSVLGQIHTALLPEPHDLDPYLPIGIRLGSFLLFPELEAGADITNNVLDTKFDAQPDAGPELKPRIRLDSDWGRHFLSFEANADRIWYSDFPIADTKNYQLLGRGRLDILSNTHLSGEIEKSQVQENPSSISITDISNANTAVLEQHATGAFDHTFNRLTVKLTGTVADYDYADDSDPTLSGPVPIVDIRDYRETLGILRSTYEFQSSWAGFIETSLNDRVYREPITSAGLRRGGSGFRALAGVNLRLGGTLFGEIAGGYGQQQPIDNGFETIEGPLVNGDLIWMPTPMTKLEFLAHTEIDETTLEDSAGAIDHFFELSLQHAFWRYLVLGVYGSYEVADFAGDPRVDRRTKLGATSEYYFNPVLSAYARYEHTDFTSTDAQPDFVEDEIKVGLKFRR